MISDVGIPFVHAFAHRERWYAYDVNTNDLLEIDQALGRTLMALSSARPESAVGRLTVDIGREPVAAALAEIVEARRSDGLFVAERPRIVPRSLAAAEWAQYDSGLSHLVLIVTEDCNLACRYCPQAAVRPESPRRMPLSVARQALTHFAERCRDVEAPAVSFYGGEPLLRLKLIEQVIGCARAHPAWPPFLFKIDTNGTLLGEAAIELIAREKIHLQVSLDGPRRTHDRWRVRRDGRGTHAAVMTGLHRLLERDPSAAERISFQVTNAPPHELQEVAAWFEDFEPFRAAGIDRPPNVRVSLADFSWQGAEIAREDGGALTSQAGCLREQWLRACSLDWRETLSPITRGLFDPEAIRFYHRSRCLLSGEISPGGCCLPGVRRVAVRPDGHLAPCERGRLGMKLGQLPGWIERERVSGLMTEFDAALAGRCSGCWAVRLCDLCFASLGPEEFGDEPVLPARCCEESRLAADWMLRHYADLMRHNGKFLEATCLV